MTAADTSRRAVSAFAGGAVGAAAAAFVLITVLWHHHRKAEPGARRVVPDDPGEEWFTSEVLRGFPMEAVRPLLLGPDAPSLNRLYMAWLFATQGHDCAWIARHLDLSAEVVRVLVDAARSRG
ncbi:hypothetical protein [Streptomyces rugosispiralis]|uniref:Secreted protein n=1 Tax=Streptomyces rugosispiralis TaxID=2967341 RepID=A0ABT1V976_9ACTN|nr:hypothetical protein [Streptomyces rugosispiralis]MCQ8193952.1 hypothetical protein [Streptomyces rugosispiralis]